MQCQARSLCDRRCRGLIFLHKLPPHRSNFFSRPSNSRAMALKELTGPSPGEQWEQPSFVEHHRGCITAGTVDAPCPRKTSMHHQCRRALCALFGRSSSRRNHQHRRSRSSSRLTYEAAIQRGHRPSHLKDIDHPTARPTDRPTRPTGGDAMGPCCDRLSATRWCRAANLLRTAN